MSKVSGVGKSPPVSTPEQKDAIEKKEGESSFDRVVEDKSRKQDPETVKGRKKSDEQPQQKSGDRQEVKPRHPVIPGSVVIKPSPRQTGDVQASVPAGSAAPMQAIQQIAQKIVQAIQTKIRPDQMDLKMNLDMGKLGQLQVQLTRGADGKMQIQLQAESLSTQEFLANHAGELLQRLEAKGLDVQNLRIQTADGQGIDLRPGQEMPQAPTAGAEAQESRHSSSQDESGGQQRQQRESEGDEETEA